MQTLFYHILNPVLFILLAGINLFGQTSNAISIKASATVIESKEIELITIQEFAIDIGKAVDGVIEITSQRDATAGLMLLRGRPGAAFRLKYAPQLQLVNNTGNGAIIIDIGLSGFTTDNQMASEPVYAVQQTMSFSPQGKYFLWIGGHINISNAPAGNYAGELIIEIEYI